MPLHLDDGDERHGRQSHCQGAEALEVAEFDLKPSSGKEQAVELCTFVIRGPVGAGAEGAILPVRYWGTWRWFTYITS